MSAFDEWLPIRVAISADGPRVHWFLFHGIAYDDAYFSQTVARAAKRPFNLAFGRTTTIETALAVARERRALPVRGLVLHASRCGSTLVSKAFALKIDTLVVAEPGPLNDVLQLDLPGLDDATRAIWLRAVADLLAAPQRPAQAQAVFKLDAWHARSLPVVTRAFPGVPWVFLARDPLEVLVSHLRTMSFMMSAANAPATLGLPVIEAVRVPREEFCARVIGEIFNAVAEARPEPARIVDHGQLPDAIFERIAPAFGIAFSETEVARLRAAAAFHAKLPRQPFVSDACEKRESASPAARAAVARWAEGPYRRVFGLPLQ